MQELLNSSVIGGLPFAHLHPVAMKPLISAAFVLQRNLSICSLFSEKILLDHYILLFNYSARQLLMNYKVDKFIIQHGIIQQTIGKSECFGPNSQWI